MSPVGVVVSLYRRVVSAEIRGEDSRVDTDRIQWTFKSRLEEGILFVLSQFVSGQSCI